MNSPVDLILLYKLVNRIPNATNPLKDIVEKYLEETGLDAIERIQENALNVSILLDGGLISSFLFRIRRFTSKPSWMCTRKRVI